MDVNTRIMILIAYWLERCGVKRQYLHVGADPRKNYIRTATAIVVGLFGCRVTVFFGLWWLDFKCGT